MPLTISRPTATLGPNCIKLHCDFSEKEMAKSIPGRAWNPKTKTWDYPLRPEVLRNLRRAFPGIKIDERILYELREIENREAMAAQIKEQGWEEAEPLEPMPVKTKPFKHQIAGFNLAITMPYHAMLYEQGCGKTLTAITVIGRRFQRGEVKRVLIVAPSSVVPVWPREFQQHADFPFSCRELSGPIKKRIEQLFDTSIFPDVEIIITNYEATWRMEEALFSWKPDMIICDESQRIKNPSARQSKAMHRLGQIAKYRLILTGTPVTQGPLDFFSQYKFLDPSIFGKSYYAFKARYAIMGGYEGKQVVGYQNLDELVQKAHSIAFRVTKKEALNLPPIVEQELYCELEPKAERLYRQLRRESIAELEGEKIITAANVLSRLLRLSQLTGGFLGDDEGIISQVSQAKMNLLKETLEDVLSAGKKVVVAARFLPEIHAIRRHLEKEGIGYGWIAGEIKQQERGEMVRRFQEDPNCCVFVAQIQTAGLGITLHAADTNIIYSMNYSYADLDQFLSRIHRIGQSAEKVTNIYLLARRTVDEKVRRVLAAKQDVARQVVDDWKELFKEV